MLFFHRLIVTNNLINLADIINLGVSPKTVFVKGTELA
jgi:hypothetical protein